MWTTLGEIGSWQSGATPSRMNKDYYGGNIPWLKTGDLNDGTIIYIPEYITQRALEETSVRLNPKGSVLIAMYGATIGKIGILSFPATTNQACCACYEYSINQMFLFYFLLANRENFIAMGGGGAQPNISKEKIISTNMPLPPLKEQERIVAEIERWLSFVDIVEKEKSDLQSTICLAKSKILDLAIHGKLVPQDPNDEPASELLKRINPKAEIITDNGHYQKVVPFKLPNGWSWTTLGSITNYGSCTTSDVLQISDSAWVLELEDIEKDSAKILSIHTKKDREIKGVRRSFKKGEILYSKLRTYLNKVLVASQDGFCTTEIIPISVSSVIDNIFLCHVLRSQYFLDYTSVCGYGVKMPRLSTKDAQNGLVPLPPRKEQLRIVSKIEELFHQLDIIEESL